MCYVKNKCSLKINPQSELANMVKFQFQWNTYSDLHLDFCEFFGTKVSMETAPLITKEMI